MQNLENLGVFLNFDCTKNAKMIEGSFCQIGAHLFGESKSLEIVWLASHENMLKKKIDCFTDIKRSKLKNARSIDKLWC